MNKDYLIKGLICENRARVFLINSTDALNEAIRRHDTFPSASSVLGKIMTISLLMGANLKGEEALTVKYNCNGPIGNIIADADAHGNVRAYVDHPHVNFVNNKGGLNEEMTLGYEGFLDVIKDLKLKDMFTSTIPATGNIANDFSAYFFQSEQTPSLIILSSVIDVDNLAKINGGILIQLMPGYTDEDVNYITKVAEGIKSPSKLFESSLEEIATSLFKDIEIIDDRDIQFHCGCSKEKFINGLYTLPIADLEDIINKEEKIVTTCHYCHEEYVIEKDIIAKIIDEKSK